MSDRATSYRAAGAGLTLVVTALILYFSFCSPERVPRLGEFALQDKAGHFLAYSAFGFSLFLALGKRRTLFVLAAGAFLGGLCEFLQPGFGRGCNFFDFIADIAGVAWGILFLWTIGHFRRKV